MAKNKAESGVICFLSMQIKKSQKRNRGLSYFVMCKKNNTISCLCNQIRVEHKNND